MIMEVRKLNKKLEKIGLKIVDLEFLGSDYVNWCEIDLWNSEKYYDFFMDQYDHLDFSDIKKHEDYQNYDYDQKTFIMEELEKHLMILMLYAEIKI